jgi:hypothetical protein
MDTRTTTTRAAGIIVLLIMIHSMVLALTNPLGEAPDEPAHMEYVRFVVVNQRLPIQCLAPCISEVDGEGHQPPLAYLLAALVSAPFIEQTAWVPQAINPQFLWRGGSDPQALVHGSREYWPWQGTILAWRLMRLASVLLVSATAWLVYRLALRISTPATALVAVLLLALTPQTAIIGSTMSNDALLGFLSAAILMLVVDTRRIRDLLGVGALLGLALLTKQSAILLLPVILIAALRLQRWSHRGMAMVLGSVVTVLVAGWWYVRNQMLYGDVFGMQMFSQTFAGTRIDSQLVQRSGATVALGLGAVWLDDHPIAWYLVRDWDDGRPGGEYRGRVAPGPRATPRAMVDLERTPHHGDHHLVSCLCVDRRCGGLAEPSADGRPALAGHRAGCRLHQRIRVGT